MSTFITQTPKYYFDTISVSDQFRSGTAIKGPSVVVNDIKVKKLLQLPDAKFHPRGGAFEEEEVDVKSSSRGFSKSKSL